MTTTGKVTLALGALALGGVAWWLFRPETEEERGAREAPADPPLNPAWRTERFNPGALPIMLPASFFQGRDSANG